MHLGVQACIAAISSFNAELTRRCRARLFFFSKSGDTIMALNAWPQPPDDLATISRDPEWYSVSTDLTCLQHRRALHPAFPLGPSGEKRW